MAETNKLLQSIGAGVNLNMTDVVEKQVRDMLTRFKNEIQKAAAQTTQFGTQAAKGLPQFMQDAAVQYYDAYIGGIDQQAELAEGDMMRMAGDLTGYVD